MERLCGNCFNRIKKRVCPYCSYEVKEKADRYALAVGTEINGRYVLGRVIGRGGFGIIYLAYDIQEQRAVAIKEYYPHGIAVRAADNKLLEPLGSAQEALFRSCTDKFCSEGSRFLGIEQGGLMGLYEVFRDNNTAYHVMEYLNGITLRDYIRLHGALTEGQAVYVAEKVASALCLIHGQDIIHRDISPDNIMLCHDGTTKLIDYGAARHFAQSDGTLSVILTQGFAPLEQYQRTGVQGAHTDIYALGATLYYALTIKTPDDPMTRLKEDESGHVLRNVSDGLRAVILRCMEIKTEQRYGSATELIDALAGCGVRSEGFDRELLGKRSWEFATSVTAGKRTNLFTEVNRRIYDLRERFIRQKAPTEVKIGKRMYSVELTDLDLSDMELTEQKIGNLHYMKKLKRLNLSFNYIYDLACISNLTQLEELTVNSNPLLNLDFLRDMTHLRFFSAENNYITDISPLEDKVMLEYAFLGDNPITDITPLSGLPLLKQVSFNEAQIPDLEPLRGKKQLTMVCLSGCNLADISPLGECPALTHVYVGRNKLTTLAPLRNCPEIEELFIDYNMLDRDVESFDGLTVNGYIAANGNGFSEEQQEYIRTHVKGKFEAEF